MLAKDALANKTIIVTGGGTGLGKSMSMAFAKAGANLVLAARNKERLDAAAEEMKKESGAEILTFKLDVRDPEANQALVDATVERFGSIEGLVNNAAGNFLCAAEDLSPGGFDAVVGIVMKGTFLATQAVGKQMIAQGKGGNILSIVTSYAWTGSAFVLPSAMAKAGVLALTRSLAVEWGNEFGIRLNAIAPGPFPTEGAFGALMPEAGLEEKAKKKIPLGRFGEHHELANLAAYLMSDYSGYINGECVTIDGGEWLKGAGEFNSYVDFDRENMKMLFGAMRTKK